MLTILTRSMATTPSRKSMMALAGARCDPNLAVRLPRWYNVCNTTHHRARHAKGRQMTDAQSRLEQIIAWAQAHLEIATLYL